MPENVTGPVGIPARGDSEQRFSDRSRLARLEAQQETLLRELAELRHQLTAQAEAILGRAATGAGARTSPRRRRQPPRRRGDTVLRVVRAAVIAAASLGVVVAMLAPARVHREQYSPRCSVACSRPVASHASHRPGK